MKLTGKEAFSASMKANTLTGSGRCPWRRRPLLFQQVPLHLQGAVLRAKAPQLLALSRRTAAPPLEHDHTVGELLITLGRLKPRRARRRA
jgi:hypothetical protein